jgi:hypothetical protein
MPEEEKCYFLKKRTKKPILSLAALKEERWRQAHRPSS